MTACRPGSSMPEPGRLYGIGTGPGDPELITLKGARLLAGCEVVAYFCKQGSRGQARQAVQGLVPEEAVELPLSYPVTTELPSESTVYREWIEAFFDRCAEQLAGHLVVGRRVAVLNEGDPFFYGSFMHVHLRLAERFPVTVIPGVTSMMASAALLPQPLVMRDDVLAVVPANLPEAELRATLKTAQAAVIMKVSQCLPAITALLDDMGLTQRAWFVSRASADGESVMPLATVEGDTAPYFSMIVIPGVGARR